MVLVLWVVSVMSWHLWGDATRGTYGDCADSSSYGDGGRADLHFDSVVCGEWVEDVSWGFIGGM